MRKITIIFICLLLGTQGAFSEEKKDKRTPFPKVEYRQNHPYVEYQGEWVKLISLAGKPVEDYLNYAREYEPAEWKLAFARYLHYIMDDMKIERGKTVSVAFEQDHKIITKDFELKEENRELATSYLEKQMGENRIKRNHSKPIPANLNYLNMRLDGYKSSAKDWLTKEEVLHDLEHLEWQIVNNYSYADLRKFNYQTAIDAIYQGVKEGISKRDFALQLKMMMANFGDGHTRVSMGRYVVPKEERNKWLPFDIIKHEDKFYAKDLLKKGFYHDKFKQVIAINDIPVENLYKLANRMVAKSTEKFIERNTTEYLFYIKFLLKLAGAEPGDELNVTFSNGKETMNETIKLDTYKWLNPSNRFHFKKDILNGNIGYLAINDHMERDNKFIDSLHMAMQYFKNTEALIIDIRGNGGGNRAPLKALLPYFIKKPKITNVARYRIDPDKDIHPKNGYLNARYSYPLDYEGFSKAEKKAIVKFQKNFKPVSVPDNEKFTEYHYMVVTPSKENDTYYYKKKVIVLVDEGCFSASDIFAAGIKQGDRVRLLGNTTGGGSGYSTNRKLPNSGIKVRMSRIYSYQPDGNMYDGHGVIPHIQKDYTLDDRLEISDTQLQSAINQLQ